MITGTVESATSALLSAMQAVTETSWFDAMRCTSTPEQPIHGAGHVTRDWQPIAAVRLNPERGSVVTAELTKGKKARAAA
jgi:hypothetical protein